ncbi:MAG TPA: hypothetical protein VN033_05910 [Vulgatibacter sp.]|nr:hypothetical protein [Vulgatibacter sp.]
MIRFKPWLSLVVALPAILAGCAGDSDEPEETPPAPVIEAFRAEPSTIELEMYSRLSWETRHATSVRIDEFGGGKVNLGKEKAERGKVDVFPTETTIYVLTASGPGGSTTASVTVKLVEPGKPQVSLAANPADVPVGGSSTLTWTATDAYRVQLFAGADSEPIVDVTEATQGTVTVSPTAPTTYRLIAEGVGGRSTAEITVGILATIDSFGPTSEAPVAVGQMVELRWKTRGAEKLVLSNGEDFEEEIAAGLIAEGTIEAPAGADGIFRLVATRGDKETIATVEVEVMEIPAVESFEADAEYVTDATEATPVEVTLRWEVSAGATLTLAAEPGGEIELDDQALSDGSITVEVEGTTVFTLVASNAVGSDSSTVTVTSVPAPDIIAFTVNPLNVAPGGDVEISWEFAHGVATLLKNEGADWEVVSEDLDPTGSITLTVDVNTDVRLSVTNLAGATIDVTHNVTVDDPV